MNRINKEMEDVFAVILAGGSGTRFWPKSRHKTPKQLCVLGDSDLSMIELTLSRLENFIPPERRIIVTHYEQAEQTKEIVGNRVFKIIAEPQAKNTAAALAVAAFEIRKICDDHNLTIENPIMISLHADHIIRPIHNFLADLEKATKVARNKKLCLVGIQPRSPETGFGYIEMGPKILESIANDIYAVESFREKPNRENAEIFVQSKKFLWNAGIFVWNCKQILTELQEFQSDVFNPLQNFYTARLDSSQFSLFKECYEKIPKIAIDHAVLERSKNVAVIPSHFDWQDVGSWDALAEAFGTDKEMNTVFGDAITIDTHNTVIDTDGLLVASLGMKDTIIVVSKGAVLVCPKSRAQDVKLIVENLQTKKRNEYL